MRINSDPDDRNVILLAINRLSNPNLEDFVVVMKTEKGFGIAYSGEHMKQRRLFKKLSTILIKALRSFSMES